MNYPLTPLAITLGSSNATIVFDVFIDLFCPFSKKIFKRICNDVLPICDLKRKDFVKFNFYLVPQPWHPQSGILHDSVIAVQMLDPVIVILYINHFFDSQENFFDVATYSKSREMINQELAEIASKYVNKDSFLRLVNLKMIEGQLNSGNETTQRLKWYVNYHRKQDVHLTPTVFMNDIEATNISSGWTIEQWNEFLDPYFCVFAKDCTV